MRDKPSQVGTYRRLGVGPKTGMIAVRALEPHGFPAKQRLFGNKRYWPAVRYFLDQHYGLIEPRSRHVIGSDARSFQKRRLPGRD
jgi:hypothetical protein